MSRYINFKVFFIFLFIFLLFLLNGCCAVKGDFRASSTFSWKLGVSEVDRINGLSTVKIWSNDKICSLVASPYYISRLPTNEKRQIQITKNGKTAVAILPLKSNPIVLAINVGNTVLELVLKFSNKKLTGVKFNEICWSGLYNKKIYTDRIKPFWGMAYYYADPDKRMNIKRPRKKLNLKKLPRNFNLGKIVLFPFVQELHFKGIDLETFYKTIDPRYLATKPSEVKTLIRIKIIQKYGKSETYTYKLFFYNLKDKKANVYTYEVPLTKENVISGSVGGRRRFVRTMAKSSVAAKVIAKLLSR